MYDAPARGGPPGRPLPPKPSSRPPGERSHLCFSGQPCIPSNLNCLSPPIHAQTPSSLVSSFDHLVWWVLALGGAVLSFSPRGCLCSCVVLMDLRKHKQCIFYNVLWGMVLMNPSFLPFGPTRSTISSFPPTTSPHSAWTQRSVSTLETPRAEAPGPWPFRTPARP